MAQECPAFARQRLARCPTHLNQFSHPSVAHFCNDGACPLELVRNGPSPTPALLARHASPPAFAAGNTPLRATRWMPPLELITAHFAMLLAPAIVGLNRHTDLQHTPLT